MFFETIPYIYGLGPTKKSPDVFLQEMQNGANCQLYVAGFLRAFGYTMPDYYRSSEIYEDPEDVLQPINCKEDSPRDGDIIGFWPKGEKINAKRIHVGIICLNRNGISVLHAQSRKGHVTCTPLIALLESYGNVACIKRPKILQKEVRNTLALEQLGFFASQQL